MAVAIVTEIVMAAEAIVTAIVTAAETAMVSGIEPAKPKLNIIIIIVSGRFRSPTGHWRNLR